jgi:superfamily II DNA or RNA helicase
MKSGGSRDGPPGNKAGGPHEEAAHTYDCAIAFTHDSGKRKFELRPYQQEAVAAVIKGFDEFKRQLLVCPTGGGKTLIFARLAEHYQPKRTLVIAHREELLQQAQDKILAATGLVAEIEAADRRVSLDSPVVVASIQSLARAARRERFPSGHFGLVVVDEAHHVLAASYTQVLAHFTGAKVLGVTATPDRGDKRSLSTYFENIAHEVGLVELVKAGYLSRIQVRTIPLQIDLRGVHSVAGDYSADELGHAIEPYLETVADVVARDFANRKTLCFLPLCALSERFANLCRERGLPAEHVDGASQDRAGVLARFRSGETALVSNAMLWTEGFDEPSIDCVIPLRPTKIRSLFSQQIGRGTRVYPGKENLLVLDFLWITQRHSVISPASLVAANEEEARGMGRDGDLLDNAELYCNERLEALARELEANKRRKAQQYDLLEISVALGDARLASFEPTMRWHGDPVTQKQFDMLERCGINPCGLRGKGHASAVIEHLEDRRSRGLATYKQVRFLTRRGVSNAHQMSVERASALISSLIGKQVPARSHAKRARQYTAKPSLSCATSEGGRHE